MLPNQTWVHSLMSSKANVLTLGRGEVTFIARAPSKESWAASAQNTQTLLWVSGKHF